MENKIIVTVEPYKGNNVYIIKLIRFLTLELNTFLIGAYVHGSLGTYEEVNYSDFDGLLIVKDEVFTDKNLNKEFQKKIKSSLKIIYEFDPLQHHGWFILKESDLNNYPETYFPHELFNYSKSLFSNKGTLLNLSLNIKLDFHQPFNLLSDSLLKKINMNWRPNNIYQLKSFLSEIMLIPSFYVQARDKKGIFKKYSFEQAKKDFTDSEWYPINIASFIRNNWNYRLNRFQSIIMQQEGIIFRKLTKKVVAPSIGEADKNKINKIFFDNLNTLLLSARIKLQ